MKPAWQITSGIGWAWLLAAALLAFMTGVDIGRGYWILAILWWILAVFYAKHAMVEHAPKDVEEGA